MKNLIYILFILISTSCTKDFEVINTNETVAVSVQPDFLLRKVLYDYSSKMSYEAFVAGNLLGQYFTAIDFNLFDRHGLSQPQYGGNPWPFLYENLRDNEILLDMAEGNSVFEVYRGPALVIKSLLFSQLTDLYGDIPYSEALNGKNGLVTPKYDNQEEIYFGENGLIANLDKAIVAIDSYQGNLGLNGDVFYNGDLEKWKKLANSLKFKLLMRASKARDVSLELKDLISGGDLILNSVDDAVFRFTSGQPNNFQMSTARIGDYNLFIMSETMQEILESFNDSRISTYFRPTGNNQEEFRGLLNGPDASQLSITLGDYSLSGTIFREQSGSLKANIFSSFEMNFLIAEAAERNLIEADARIYYENGVSQAFQFWNTEMPFNYLSEGKAVYDNGTMSNIELIITQKWLGNILNGYEGWTEYRRTGFPNLKTISASLNQNLIPVRMPYPASEEAFNRENYGSAASQTNNNSINSPVWWDK